MKGRKPKPATEKLLAGNPGKRAIPTNPTPMPGALTPPPSLSGLALATWHEIVAQMVALGSLGAENARLIERYATLFARWREAEGHIAQHGVMVAAPRTGMPVVNPLLKVAHDCSDRLLKIEAELGFTPQSRSRIALPPPPPSDTPADEFAV